jgi:hypothetical protein
MGREVVAKEKDPVNCAVEPTKHGVGSDMKKRRRQGTISVRSTKWSQALWANRPEGER